ncbi:glycosyltransferase [Paenibacillus massiliensis]|uniref:glycosyltransferase n=1 Tax=Paenibacillus massiliensis TaxID=225917 RepID=UPI00036F6E0F|nr:glycosyltransferase [Paenibacillus massiliensis]
MEPLVEGGMVILLVIGCALLLQWGFALWNASVLPILGQSDGLNADSLRFEAREPSGKPVLSILIPARNEEAHIQACLEHVLSCDRQGITLELLILNDRSEDATAALVKECIARQATASVDDSSLSIRMLQGAVPPKGWLGKSYACHQLATAAQGTWLLFMDADVRLAPDALQAALRTAVYQGKGLITGFPRQVTMTWLERLIVPMMMFTIICHLPIALIKHSRSPLFVAAMGAFLLIHRDSYSAAGGHEAIRAAMVDDMSLARAVKRAGHPVTLASVFTHVHMRMYCNAAEVWNGFTKNVYDGIGRQPWLLVLLILSYSAMYLIPVLILGGAVVLGESTLAGVSLAAVLLGMAIKRTADRAAGGQPLWHAALLPLSIVGLLLIAIRSWYGAASGKGYYWKGRWYS